MFAVSATFASCDIYTFLFGEEEEPYKPQGEQAKAQSGTINGEWGVIISVTGNMTDAQWQIGFPRLQSEFSAAINNNTVDAFAQVFLANNVQTIVLEWRPGYNYKADAYGTPDAKIHLNVEVITAANILAAVTAAASNTGGQDPP
jgi:hypothetical protein